jgi:NAD(P)-dependent dehydrogenase (short-subunit alcohol dehydrogenase family)
VVTSGAVVVTGAASGIGRALALRAARDRRPVAICDVAPEGLAETERGVRELGVECTSGVFDVRDEAALAAFADRVPGPIGLVFANAGVLRSAAVSQLSPAVLRFMFEINVFALHSTVTTFLPRLRAQPSPSRMVLLGSTASFESAGEGAPYCATKHAVWALAQGLRDELDAEGGPVGVSVVAPGVVRTAIFATADEGDRVISAPAASSGGITPDEAAERIFAGLDRGAFLIATHPEELPGVVRATFEATMRELV